MGKKGRKLMGIALLCGVITGFLSGCVIADDYELSSLMLLKPPSQLIYVPEQDKELNLEYGRIREFQDFGKGYYFESRLSSFGPDAYGGKYFYSQVDFTNEGTYLVTLKKNRWFSVNVYFQFTVQVVMPEQYRPHEPSFPDGFISKPISPTTCENVTALMISPPDNIVYPVGYEGQIDPAGIVVRAAKSWFARRYDIAELDYAIESDVDFNAPGSYIVKVTYADKRGMERWFIFTVAVAQRVG